VTGEQHRAHQTQNEIFHKRLPDAIQIAEIHMDVWHDKEQDR
jgi:hypothetical protein